jgi:hypothetical protein
MPTRLRRLSAEAVNDVFSVCDMIKFLVSTVQGVSHIIIVGLLISSLAPKSEGNIALIASPYLIYTSAAMLFIRDFLLWGLSHEFLAVDYPVLLCLAITIGVLIYTLGEYCSSYTWCSPFCTSNNLHSPSC